MFLANPCSWQYTKFPLTKKTPTVYTTYCRTRVNILSYIFFFFFLRSLFLYYINYYLQSNGARSYNGEDSQHITQVSDFSILFDAHIHKLEEALLEIRTRLVITARARTNE